MEFINLGKPIRIRIGTSKECYWKTVKRNEIIDLPRVKGQSVGLTELKTTKGQIGNKVVETKQIENSKKVFVNMKEEDWPYNETKNLFLEELQSINGIGKKTSLDIFEIFKTKEELIKKIKEDDQLPLRDDIEEKLRRNYA